MRRGLLVVLSFLLLVGCGPSKVDAQPSVVSTPTPTPTPTPMPSLQATPTPTPTRTVPTPRQVVPKPRKTARVLQSNKLYAAGKVGAVPCPLPEDWLSTQADVTRYARRVLACLDQAWAPVVKRASFRFRPPVLHIFKGTVETPCADSSADAFYCEDGHGIYLDWTTDGQVPSMAQVDAEMDLLYTMAHEYGHHLQNLTSIEAYYDSHLDGKKRAAQLEDSRRLELQADCFAAVFLKGNQQTLNLTGSRYWALDLGSHGDEYRKRGEPRDHGSATNNARWTLDAFTSGDLASCNTWTAPAEYVS
ncbi:neutral zinc metallopeptidase [Kribbella sp. NPDC026611]|uniref:neutral zinc metallopeptidase n=1 Tax=Kribbella sp. NPDC026611 TaxID=3154911 RepID=UPI0033C42F96